MKKKHQYNISIEWIGNKGEGTKDYRAYDRDYWVSIDGKPKIIGSSDPAFLGNKAAINPEEMLVASISACHMLWFLHLAAESDVVIVSYIDQAKGKMIEKQDGSGYFEHVELFPHTNALNGTNDLIESLHHLAHEKCFIANSMNFPVLIHASHTIHI